MIEVMLVDDDALTLELHRGFVERVPGFRVAAECSGARAATHALVAADGPRVDLVLLDMTMPDGTGLDVLRRVRAHGSTVDVIAVTSAREAETVRATASLGVVQYLVKPFPFVTFRERLEQYGHFHTQRAAAHGRATQTEIDALLTAGRTGAVSTLPKGLSAATMSEVIRVLRAEGPLSATEAAARLGLSRVVARRYLERLVDERTAARGARHGRPGRPESEYRWLV